VAQQIAASTVTCTLKGQEISCVLSP
jgi:hypothetical protein